MYNFWKKNIISWKINNTLYISIIFSWQLLQAQLLTKTHKGKIIIGGIAAELNKDKIDWAEVKSHCEFDVLSMHNPFATFTTRGCIRKCEFCAVPKVEEKFLELDDFKVAPIICDNNFLASSKKHITKVIDKIKYLPYVDFNQGLDARLLKDWHLDEFSKLKNVKIRFAFDNIKDETKVIDAFLKCKKYGFKNFGCYVLIGFNDTSEDAQYRLEKIRQLGIFPNVMRFQPLNCKNKNDYVNKNWTESELRHMTRYYSRLNWLDNISYNEYNKRNIKQSNLTLF